MVVPSLSRKVRGLTLKGYVPVVMVTSTESEQMNAMKAAWSLLKADRECRQATATDPESGRYYYCTLPEGHMGSHNAEGQGQMPEREPMGYNPFDEDSPENPHPPKNEVDFTNID